MFKPGTGLFNVGPNNVGPTLSSFTYSQNQTYSQYMFKPVVLLAVNSLTNNAAPKFNVEIKVNIVGRGIRALPGVTANVGIMGENVAQPSDVAAGKVFYNQNGDSFTGIKPPPVKTIIPISENNVSYKIEDFTGGYPASSDTEITVAIPPTNFRIPIDSLQLYDIQTGAQPVVPFNSLTSFPLSDDGYVGSISSDYVLSRGSYRYVAYLTFFESGSVDVCLNFSTVYFNNDAGSYEMYTKYNANTVDRFYFIPASYFEGFSDYTFADLVVSYGSLQSGEFTSYISSIYGFYRYTLQVQARDYDIYYGGVGLDTEIFELASYN